MFMTGRYNAMMTQQAVTYRCTVNISSQTYDPHHKRWKYHSLCGAMFGYVSMSEKANMKLVELVGEFSIM